METSTLRFEAPGKGIIITLYADTYGEWIVIKWVRGSWRKVCETELFEYAKHVFDVEVTKVENVIRCEVEGC